MLVLKGRNVNVLWAEAVAHMMVAGVPSPSRNGPVRVAPYPVTSVYERPTERVLFDPLRDANPFFHLFESLWMLAGRDDSAFLDRFVRDFGSRYAEEGGALWGAYGVRWRRSFEDDQLDIVIARLRGSREDRRCVITMWDPSYDLWDPRPDSEWSAKQEPKDLPCNTHLYPLVRGDVLDLTVCCRSNDIVWGAYGANAVHFSVLHEYLAGRVGVGIGTMYQISNNWHAYDATFGKFADSPPERWHEFYGSDYRPLPMGSRWDLWDDDNEKFLRWAEQDIGATFANSWFEDVARPMWVAHQEWRSGDLDGAVRAAKHVAADDWRDAATNWLERRRR